MDVQNNKSIVETINNYLSNEKWCDFSILELNDNLRIGGMTGFEEEPDITVIFKDVFLVRCNCDWQTDTNGPSFFVASQDEAMKINNAHSVDIGYTLFKILAEDIAEPFYVSARDIIIIIQPKIS